MRSAGEGSHPHQSLCNSSQRYIRAGPDKKTHRISVSRPRFGNQRMLLYAVVLSLLAVSWAEECQVANIQVMQNFDRSRYTGRWYAVAKKDPQGLFLLDNIVANFVIEENGKMTARAMGRVNILNNWEMCADMYATFMATEDPAKFKMKYWGATAYLQTGNDEHWVIDTDYDNYAVHYSCRVIDSDGTCLDSYSFIFSRHATGLRAVDQANVQQKKLDICLMGKYRRVEHTGFCDTELELQQQSLA